MRKIGLTEIQKQTIAQHLREGIGQTKNQHLWQYITFIKKAMFITTQIFNFWICSVILCTSFFCVQR
jgi:hypothetical protein